MDIAQKIKAMSLTKTEKRIADYILDHIDMLGLKTITELAGEIGVSDTSIIRFLRSLGFSGYSDFKREMSARMMTQYCDALSPGEKYRKTKSAIRKENLIRGWVSPTPMWRRCFFQRSSCWPSASVTIPPTESASP